MKISNCKANYSLIVTMGEQLIKMQKETGKEFLMLNRGVNSVCHIEINDLCKSIDFNSRAIQVYPPIQGQPQLLSAINQEFLNNKASENSIFVTPGGVSGLDLTIQTLGRCTYYLPKYYWGAYTNILKLRERNFDFYEDFSFLLNNKKNIQGQIVIICDPNNPLGDKADDEELFNVISELNNNGTIVIFDSPYRRIFKDYTDSLYQRIMDMENVIIIESFSKSLGISGQRAAFVHCNNQDFGRNFKTRLLFSTNGTNGFVQKLIEMLLVSDIGKKAVYDFKTKTVEHISKNINYLQENNMLLEDVYQHTKPTGIFTVVKKSQEELLKHNIGSVSLHYFTQIDIEEAKKYARISVSVPHEKFISYFDKLK